MPVTTDELIGERVHQELWRRRMTQLELATQLGIQQSSMSRKLRGRRPWLASELVVVARYLDVDVALLFEGARSKV